MVRHALCDEVLAAWQRLSGRSDSELAKLANVTTPNLSRWRHGLRSIPLDAAAAIALVTGIPLERLIKPVSEVGPSRSDRISDGLREKLTGRASAADVA